ncbi:MAG: hypothetical protein FJ290_14470 [Planctomycetes bacterium]|nr:hypothetical protein [Planctomycetota bacterium]
MDALIRLPGLLAACAGVALAAEPLVGHWMLDDQAAGREVRDSSLNALHGVFSAHTAGSSRQGKVGRSLEFPGKAFVDLSRHAAQLGKLADFTLSMWIQHAPGPSRILFSWSDGTLNHRVQVEVHNATLSFGWQNGQGWQSLATPPLTWQAGTWYHVAFVNDGASGKTVVRSNDGAMATGENTLGPRGLRVAPTHVQIGGLNGAYHFTGCIDDVRLYDIALSEADVRALFLGKPITGKPAARVPVAGLTAVERDWLYQAEKKPLLRRAQEEIAWAEDIARRAGVERLAGELAALAKLKAAAQEMAGGDEPEGWKLYRAVREVKRKILFARPELDFGRVLFVDVPYTRGPEWPHQSRYHSAMCAAHGGRLLVLDGLSPDGKLAELAPREGAAAFLRPDLSYDGQRVLFCMKPQKDKSYHLYEVSVDGANLRKITHGSYSDLDPVYLPDGGYAFVSTRANIYAQCGMWAPQHVISRCDADGRNIYVLSPASEPDYSPSVLADGRVVYTRWEYIDKNPNRIQSLWVTRPDGTGQNAFWGNQSVYPDHIGEARQVPGTTKVMFAGLGHHNIYTGSIGIIDPARGLNFPHGLVRVTTDVPWGEVGCAPADAPPASPDYHTAGRFESYKSPYPLSEELFLVSARKSSEGFFSLYLMDVHGNRELVYTGSANVLYAQPVRPRPRPPILSEVGDWPGSERAAPPIQPAVFASADVFDGAQEEAELRKRSRFLRVIESLPKTYSAGIVTTGGGPFGSGDCSAWGRDVRPANPAWGDSGILSGPATGLAGPLALKRVLGTVPIAADGSVCFEVPPARAVYFQLLDENHRALHAMRSWTSARPGERRACLGCHETTHRAPSKPFPARAVDKLAPPPWGVKSLSYLHDIQPLFDRHCGKCHQGDGKAVKTLDLTLRPSSRLHHRWARVFPEPYLSLLIGPRTRIAGWGPDGGGGESISGVVMSFGVPYDVLKPMTALSYRSKLISMLLDANHPGSKLPPADLQMLIAWVDTWGMYRSEEDIRGLHDPDPKFFADWPYPPRLKTAPSVRTEYSQDEYNSQEDRLPKDVRAQAR